MAASVNASEPAMAPESSVYSSSSLKNVSSKVVKGLGQTCLKKGGSSSAETVGGGSGMGGALGFGGSMLGEVLVSYSTTSLPPAKRYSISATSAHYEELAAEAGIDLDADEINIEDLRLSRIEDESGYALGGGGEGGIDGDDDDNDDDENDLLGSNHHRISHQGDHADSSANQKLAHKERSILQMVDVLSDRLTSLNAVVVNRYNGCKSDLDEATDFRSSRTKKMAIVAEEDWNSTTPRKGPDKSKQRSTIFNQGPGGGGDGAEGGDTVGPLRMTFRNAPQTDAGRKLAHQFEQGYALQASSAVPKFNKTTTGKLKRVDHYKKNESRKYERLHFERKLQSNLDQYVTRAVTELVYRVPGDLAGNEDEEDDAEDRGNRNEGGSQNGTVPPVTNNSNGGTQRDGIHAHPSSAALADPMTRERFPIPMEPNEMNPKLLLSYACERTVLPGGVRVFKHFATSLESQHLFVYMFWFIHCKFFQEDSQREQAHLLRSVSNSYVGVLGTEGMEGYKDFFFKNYPFLIANAVVWGFHYLCPGSRHLYSNAFKRVLYLQCARILSGIEITPSSTTEMRAKLFPDEVAESLDDLEYHPHHVHAPGTRTTAGGAATVGASATTASAVSGGAGAGSSVPSTVGGVSPPPEVGGGGGVAGGRKPSTSPAGEGGAGRGSTEMGGLETEKDDGSGSVGKVKSDGSVGERRERSGGGGEGTMIQRMNKTFRPDPLGAYTGDRSTLRFKPKRQEGLTKLRPRQQRTIFDSAQISPMLQEFLRQSSSTAGRRSENIVRTVPVPWCQSGGSDTYRRHPSRKEMHDAMNSEHAKAKREFARGRAQAAKALRRTLRKVDMDRRTIFKRGPRQVGLKSMDIVTDLQGQGAFKGFKRSTWR